MARPANNGCGEDSYVSHAIVTQNFGGSTRDVRGKMVPFKCFKFGRAFAK